MKLASCKSALNPPVVYSTDPSKAVVPVLVLLFVALWFILRGDLLYIFLCVILFLCFSGLLVLRLPRLGKRELILVLFVRLFDLCLFGFIGFLFLLGSGKGCVLWLWHSLDFSLTFLFSKLGIFTLPGEVVVWGKGIVQLIFAYSWARPAILAAGKGRGGIWFCFLLFLHFHSFSFLPCPSLSSPLLSISLLPFSVRRHKMTHKGWRVTNWSVSQLWSENWSVNGP